MNAENCCVEESAEGVGLCMLAVVPLPAQIGKGKGLDWAGGGQGNQEGPLEK